MQHVFAYARDHSVVVASDEPYVGYDTACRRHRARSWVDVKQFEVMSIDNDPYLELRMATLIKRHGPLAAGIDSSILQFHEEVHRHHVPLALPIFTVRPIICLESISYKFDSWLKFS